MTTTQVFADYCGLTPESAPWAWTEILWCPKCDSSSLSCTCGFNTQLTYKQVFAATSPLAPSPTPGWLEALVRHADFFELAQVRGGFSVCCRSDFIAEPIRNPTHAVARALLKTDPALRAQCESCEDWALYKEIVK